MSHRELARLLGVTRPALSETLARLASEGVVETGRRRLRLVDPDEARAIAAEGAVD